ncbi:MAG: DUF1848 domain-containing protein, partial [Akkermansiaceae bacterium]|nr:DUF1848 domain-containing protein [Akkermansiaceae bacterium]
MVPAAPCGVVTPVILSASRATDIPAVYADWFMHRVRAGFFRWTNPFNSRQVQTVSVAQVRAIVFWSKHPAALGPHLDELDRRGFHYYFQYTLNDYEAEGWEPGEPPLSERLALFRRLADRLGPERVIWRFDPLLLTDRLRLPELLEKIRRLMDRLVPHTRKLVLSFADIDRYPAVRRSLARAGIAAREFAPEEMQDFARGLAEINRPHGLELATCAEAADLSAWGVVHNRCIDGELLARLWPEDAALMDFLAASAARKDNGQRPACRCIASKDIGRYRTCPRGCV